MLLLSIRAITHIRNFNSRIVNDDLVLLSSVQSNACPRDGFSDIIIGQALQKGKKFFKVYFFNKFFLQHCSFIIDCF